MAVTITDQNFAEETASGLVLLDFLGRLVPTVQDAGSGSCTA